MTTTETSAMVTRVRAAISIRPDLAQFSVSAGGESAQVVARTRRRRRPRLQLRVRRPITPFELRCAPISFVVTGISWIWKGAGRVGYPTSEGTR